MKAKLSGKILAFRHTDDGTQSFIEVDLLLKGKIESNAATGKEIEATLQLRLKPLFAEKLHFGQTLYICVDTDEDGCTCKKAEVDAQGFNVEHASSCPLFRP